MKSTLAAPFLVILSLSAAMFAGNAGAIERKIQIPRRGTLILTPDGPVRPEDYHSWNARPQSSAPPRPPIPVTPSRRHVPPASTAPQPQPQPKKKSSPQLLQPRPKPATAAQPTAPVEKQEQELEQEPKRDPVPALPASPTPPASPASSTRNLPAPVVPPRETEPEPEADTEMEREQLNEPIPKREPEAMPPPERAAANTSASSVQEFIRRAVEQWEGDRGGSRGSFLPAGTETRMAEHSAAADSPRPASGQRNKGVPAFDVTSPLPGVPAERRAIDRESPQEPDHEQVQIPAAPGDTLFVVTRHRSPFYCVGPEQAMPPNQFLVKGTLVTLVKKREGWSDVRLSSGESGVIASDFLREADPDDLQAARAEGAADHAHGGAERPSAQTPAPALPAGAAGMNIGGALFPRRGSSR